MYIGVNPWFTAKNDAPSGAGFSPLHSGPNGPSAIERDSIHVSFRRSSLSSFRDARNFHPFGNPARCSGV